MITDGSQKFNSLIEKSVVQPLAQRQCGLLVAALAILLQCGCPRQDSGQPADSAQASAEPRPSVTLRALVVNEPELAEAVNRLRGEWAERSGGALRVSSTPWPELISGDTIDADVIVFPSRYLGELCAKDWLRTVRQNVLDSDDVRSADFFPLVRLELIQWGGDAMALPLGVGRAAIGEAPPDRPSIRLLAQAASAAASKHRLGVLFDTETMQPRITDSPFVEALERIAQANGSDAPPRPKVGDWTPVLGYSDCLAAVTSTSRNAASAFKLLEWLARPEISSQIAAVAGGQLPVRESLASAAQWYDSKLSASQRTELAQRLVAALNRPSAFLLPRIVGIDEYLAALDEAVRAVVLKNADPRAALEQASERWEAITDIHGRDAQRQAYLNHLGIAEP